MDRAASINRLPFGMLGFLGIKNGGRNPEVFSAELQATWDLQQLYFRTNMKLVRVNFNATGIGFTSPVPLLVPDNEVWACHGGLLNSVSGLAAGQSISGFFAAANQDGAPSANVTPLGEYISASTPTVWASPWKWPTPQYLPPGTSVGAYVTAIAAGPIAVSAQLWYSRLDT